MHFGLLAEVQGHQVSNWKPEALDVTSTHRLLSSSFLGLPYRILNINNEKELLRSLWVVLQYFARIAPLTSCLLKKARFFGCSLGAHAQHRAGCTSAAQMNELVT